MASFREWTTTIAAWATIVSIIVGGAWGLAQFNENARSARVKETIDYSEHFYMPPLSKSLSRIVKHWEPLSEDLKKQQEAGDQALAQYVISEFAAGDIEEDAWLLINFFERLKICTCSRLCEDTLVVKFFKKPAYDFWGLAFPLISERRSSEPEFGEGLERLARYHADDPDFSTRYCADNPHRRWFSLF